MNRYLVALGSNRRHGKGGSPRQIVAGMANGLGAFGRVEAFAPVIDSAPIGPARRRFANGAAILRSHKSPEELLRVLKRFERRFGRRPGGGRWGDRVLDCDIILWDGGVFESERLSIPHRLFRERAFVLGPASAIAPAWRDPVTGLTLRHLLARLTRPRPLLRDALWSGR